MINQSGSIQVGRKLRITMIAVYGEMGSDGTRLISALLKREGHCVKSIFMVKNLPFDYSQEEIEQMDAILKNTDLVMVAVYSSFIDRAMRVTNFVRQKYPGIKIIWGGPHCTGEPELSLKYADGVCYTEADEAIVKFINSFAAGDDYTNTFNMGFRQNGHLIINKVKSPPIEDLNSLPYFDHDMNDQFILDDELVPVTKQLAKDNYSHFLFGVPTLYMMLVRGCAFKCTFCNNRHYNNMYGRSFVRYRSVEHTIGELKNSLKTLDFIDRVAFLDSDFFLHSQEYFEEFGRQYKKEIGLPFCCYTTANAFRPRKMEILLDSGLSLILMGVQSGSQRTVDEVFERNISVVKTQEVAKQLAEYKRKHKFNYYLEIIIDNPYETPDDIIKTYYYLLNAMESSAFLMVYALAFYPGNELYNRALKDGYIDESHLTFENAFKRFSDLTTFYQHNYETMLTLIVYVYYRRNILHRMPWGLMRWLGNDRARAVASKFPKRVYKYLNKFVNKFIPNNCGCEILRD